MPTHTTHLPTILGVDLNERKLTAEYVLLWGEDQIERGTPRQLICEMLVSTAEKLMANKEAQFGDNIKLYVALRAAAKAITEAERKLYTPMINRNAEGIRLENAGQTDDAIKLYEANIRDMSRSITPYERLRVLYLRRRDFVNAIRVCQAAIRNLAKTEIAAKTVSCDPEYVERLKEAYKAEMEKKGQKPQPLD
mgnify:CR=1 FL=1